MSSWSDMIKNKLNDEKIEINQKKKQVKYVLNKANNDSKYDNTEYEDLDYKFYRTYGLKNVEEEYDYKYANNIGVIIVEFRDLLSNYKAYDISNKFAYNLYDFIKYYSKNYDKLIKTVKKYNDKLEEELEKELEEEEENSYY